MFAFEDNDYRERGDGGKRNAHRRQLMEHH
jgi:hypothetical protein